MDRLTSMRVFRAVVEEGAFNRAAHKLALSRAAVSKHLAALEAELCTRLLHRTTRSLSLTSEGARYYPRVVSVLDELDALEQETRAGSSEARGTLRISAPTSFGLTRLGPIVADFLRAHPQVQVQLSLTDRFVDVVEEGLDVAIRVALELEDSSLVGRRLGTAPRVLVASPGYLDRHGAPIRPEDLTGHACLRYTRHHPLTTWSFRNPEDDERVRVRVDGPLACDNSLGLRSALVAGLGLTLTPRFVVQDALDDGLLVTCMEPWTARAATIHAVYPTRRHVPAKVATFLEHVQQALAPGSSPPPIPIPPG